MSFLTHSQTCTHHWMSINTDPMRSRVPKSTCICSGCLPEPFTLVLLMSSIHPHSDLSGNNLTDLPASFANLLNVYQLYVSS